MTSIARCLVTLLLTTISLTSTTPAESIKQQAKLDPRQIFKLYNDSVVTIETDLGKGSGFFVKDGSYVATCFHVVAGASHIEIHGTKNEKWLIESVAFDKDTDAALLKLTDQSKRRSIPVGDYSKLVTGEDLCVIGNPLGFLD
jgi:serine protease Do